MDAPPDERTACVECDLIVTIQALEDGERACCPRCGHVLSVRVPDGQTRALAYAVTAATLLLLANAFPFLELEASGLERVMTLPRTAVELYRDGHVALVVMVIGPIIAVPALLVATLLLLLVPLRRRRPVPWLVPAGRLVSWLEPWSMVEVFVIGVLVSLIKIASMADVVMGISFFAYVGFTLSFIGALASLDRMQLWREIEATRA